MPVTASLISLKDYSLYWQPGVSGPALRSQATVCSPGAGSLLSQVVSSLWPVATCSHRRAIATRDSWHLPPLRSGERSGL